MPLGQFLEVVEEVEQFVPKALVRLCFQYSRTPLSRVSLDTSEDLCRVVPDLGFLAALNYFRCHSYGIELCLLLVEIFSIDVGVAPHDPSSRLPPIWTY